MTWIITKEGHIVKIDRFVLCDDGRITTNVNDRGEGVILFDGTPEQGTEYMAALSHTLGAVDPMKTPPIERRCDGCKFWNPSVYGCEGLGVETPKGFYCKSHEAK